MKKLSFAIVIMVLSLAASAGCSGQATKSVDAVVNSEPVEQPTTPRHLRAETNSREVILIWDMPSWADRYSFNIYRWRTGREPKLLDTVPAGVHHYVDKSAAQGKRYFYMVVTTDGVSEVSDCSAQIKNIALLPPAPVETASWSTGVTPPEHPTDPEGEKLWNLQRLEEIRQEMPWTCVMVACGDCDGEGVVVIPQTSGPPVITFCASCRGTGLVLRVTPR